MSDLTVQEMFFDAVIADPEMTDAQKIEWLRECCADYFGRIERLTAENARHVAKAQTEIARRTIAEAKLAEWEAML